MRTLIIAAHGSRNKKSAGQVAALAGQVEAKAGKLFDRIYFSFLQFSDPLLPDVIETAVKDGATQVVVFPFFMAIGSHVLSDIPQIVEQAGKDHPGVAFSITRHLGAIPALEDVIVDEVKAHLEGEL